ncbi:MAG: alpha/beta hydrolase [Candidatus Heimdallarchaeota archaeon]
MSKEKNGTIIPGAEPFYIEKGKVGCLLCHGFTGTPNEVRKVGEYLASKDITVIGPRLPGHGTTIDELKTTNYKDWYQEYERAYQKLAEVCDEIFIGGLSLGGALTLHFATQNDVAGVIAMAAPAKLKQPVMPILLAFGSIFRKIAVKKSKKELAGQQKYNILAYKKYPIGPARSLVKLILKIKKNLANITAPILIIQGLLDARWLRVSSIIIFDKVSSDDKELILLRESPHNLTEGPEVDNVQKTIYQFIKRKSKNL